MNITMHKHFVMFLLLACSYTGVAQTQPRFMVGATGGLMSGFAKSVNDKFDAGPGGSVYANWRVANKSGLSLSAQYYHLRSTFGVFDSHEDVEASYVALGFRFDVTSDRQTWVPYLVTNFGWGRTTNFVREVLWDTTSAFIKQSVASTAINFSVGCNIHIWQKSGINTEFRTVIGEDSGLTLGILTGYFVEF